MQTKSIKELMDLHQDKELHLFDIQGILGELPIKGNENLIPEVVKVRDASVFCYTE